MRIGRSNFKTLARNSHILLMPDPGPAFCDAYCIILAYKSPVPEKIPENNRVCFSIDPLVDTDIGAADPNRMGAKPDHQAGRWQVFPRSEHGSQH